MPRILIVEDNEDNRELITFILEHHGYETEIATCGEDGVAAAAANVPDAILLDIQLPDIDGLEVLHRIRTSINGAEVPIVAITSHAMSGDRDRLLAAGCNGYIEKPINPATVVDQIQGMLKLAS